MKTKADELSEKILEYLLNNRNNGGGKKEITEKSIALRFRVSRTPVREILKHLEREGLIETRKNRGIVFRPFSEKDIKNVYTVRANLEDLAIREAVKNLTPVPLHLLKTYARTYTEARLRLDRTEGERADLLFHETIMELSGNWYLNHLVKKTRMFSAAFTMLEGIKYRERKDLNPYSHTRIIRAMETGNPEAAADIMKNHIFWSMNGIVKLKNGQKKGGGNG